MRFPFVLIRSLGAYLVKQKLLGQERFPLVLMLEPTHRCNLACTGCGRLHEYRSTLRRSLSAEACLAAVDECGAPVVSLCGGEPLIYGPVRRLITGILARKKTLYLCTNGLLLEGFLDRLAPDPRLHLNIHLDGLAHTHDAMAGQPGVFRAAVRAIKKAKRMGFRVCTNTTIYRTSDLDEIEALFAYLTHLGVDGLLVSPGYRFEAHEDGGTFLERREIHARFQAIRSFAGRFPLHSSPLYMDFLAGRRRLRCAPWGNVTRNPVGWKSPCYLITDAHYPTYTAMMAKTDWDRYTSGEDPRCSDCMMHSGFEAAATLEVMRSPMALGRTLTWQFSDRR